MPTRKTEIDVAKGFALFLVVFGHVLESHGLWFNWIFTFHMPAFFFLSGMTFRPEKYLNYRHFLKDKWKKRILPYFMITAIGFLICMLRPDYRLPVLQDGLRYQLTWIFYYAQPKNLYIGQCWFLIGLFMAELFSYTWFRLFGNRSLTAKGYSLVALAFIATHIRAVDAFLPMDRLPWKIDTGFGAAVFVIAGYYATQTKIFEKLRPASLVLIPLGTLLSYYFGPKLFGYVNICDCVYSAAPYYFTAAFLGILPLMLTAQLLKNSRFWQYCGRYSLPLFASQTFAIYLVVEAIAKVTGKLYTPMHDVGDKLSLAISLAAFALMLLFVLPWHLYKSHKSDKNDKNGKNHISHINHKSRRRNASPTALK
ncbi:MAG: acyltransferase family protein [bacterium]|nr:acyltransferase family protein [bacterium]